jgi:hypothetical protein
MTEYYTLVHIDTANYGWVVSSHYSLEAAELAYDRVTRKLPAAAIPSAMYRIVRSSRRLGRTGERVRA